MAAKDAIAEFELENQEIRGKNRTTFWLCFPPKPFSAALCFFSLQSRLFVDKTGKSRNTNKRKNQLLYHRRLFIIRLRMLRHTR